MKYVIVLSLCSVSRKSHPTGVRGLKYRLHRRINGGDRSHPTGVRGLKFVTATVNGFTSAVAPHWGAWIEIQCNLDESLRVLGRTPLGCVD